MQDPTPPSVGADVGPGAGAGLAAHDRPGRLPASVWVVIALFLLLVLAFYRTSLWYDESTLFTDADRTVQNFAVNQLVRELWLPLVGDSQLGIRLLPALLGAVAVLCAARAAARLGGDALVGACLFAGLPVVLQQGVELRHYALALICAGGVLEALAALDERPTARRYAWLVALGGLAVHTHYTLALALLAPQGLVLVDQALSDRGRRAIRVRALVLVPLGQGLLALPALLQIPAMRAHYAGLPSYYPGVGWGSVAEVLRELSPLPWPTWLAALSGIALAAWVVQGWRDAPPSRRRLLIGLALGPWLAVGLGSLYQPMMVSRVLMPVVPALAASAALAWPGRPRLRRGLAVGLGLAGALAFASGRWQREDMRGALAALAREARPGDGLVLHPPFVSWVYQTNLRLMRPGLPPLQPLPLEAPTWTQAAQVDWEGLPPRTFLLCADQAEFRAYSQPLLDEARARCAEVRVLATPLSYRLVLVEAPLDAAAALARLEAGPPDPVPARQRLRAGVLLLRAGRFAAALQQLQAVQLPSGLARDPQEERVERGQVAWLTAVAALRAGRGATARAALAEAERWGVAPPASLRAEVQAAGGE